jgi:hypothetical protein
MSELVAVHTVPVYEGADGLVYGTDEMDEPGELVGWANLIEVELYDERYLLLVTAPAGQE